MAVKRFFQKNQKLSVLGSVEWQAKGLALMRSSAAGAAHREQGSLLRWWRANVVCG
ncbi:hypothetical protein [Pseudomonas taiwanensis]|uniref:Uncharacterized protein n=1 Tax=Pseudomonas taiwanensis TaxID=470150 RepID=A0ABR6V0U4_9PSED|nr:hypothetical protein [Pseudomonas taiwanensis]MBC3474107.1 hypothetical protein [Pseudomonas taiwanensis]